MSSATLFKTDPSLTRRSFLRVSTTAAGGLLVSLYFDLPLGAQQPEKPKAGQEGQGPKPEPKVYPPEAFVHIRPDGKIVIQVNRLEFGQGVQTALPMLLADEIGQRFLSGFAQWLWIDGSGRGRSAICRSCWASAWLGRFRC